MKNLTEWLVKILQLLIDLLEKKEKEYTQKTLVEDKVVTKKPIEVKGVNLLLIRRIYTDNSIIGNLYLNGEEFCYTLELPWRGNQKRISCIPAGDYKVRVRPARQSATRKYVHLIVEEVHNRSYILFHRGNRPKDTLGCILVGQTYSQDFVGNSTIAMDLLMKEIINLGGENINLIIKNT